MVIRWLVGAEKLSHRWLNGQRFRCPRRCLHLRALDRRFGWPGHTQSAPQPNFGVVFWSSFWVSHQQLPPTTGSHPSLIPLYPPVFPSASRRKGWTWPPWLWALRPWAASWPSWSPATPCLGDGRLDPMGHVGDVGPKSCTQQGYAQIYGFYILDILVNMFGI